MQLWYHKGNNFGDQLNPYIFNELAPELFNKNDGRKLIGIGSLLGFLDKIEGEKIIFSSGLALGDSNTYGNSIDIDSDSKIICVRGPLTAKALKIDPNFAVTDGAALLNYCSKVKTLDRTIKYRYSFMPHCGSENMFDWKTYVENLDIHYISPSSPVDFVLTEIGKSEVLFTEALHGAIVADLLRVPWAAIKSYKTVNSFKWEDWHLSLDMKINTLQFYPLFNKNKVLEIIRNKQNVPGFLKTSAASIFNINQEAIAKRKNKALFRQLKNNTIYSLSDLNILNQKSEILFEKLTNLKNSKYD